jgi:hypothetical protein
MPLDDGSVFIRPGLGGAMSSQTFWPMAAEAASCGR